MRKRKTVLFLTLVLIIISIGCWKISRKRGDITRTDVESIPGTEDVVDAEEEGKEENQYSNIPFVYWDIMDQYKKILEADIDDVGQDFYQKKFLKGGEWEFVWDELYVAGEPDEICYSLEDLTGDGFPEMIMGTEVGGYWSEGQFIESNFEPYVIYYYNSKNEIEIAIARTKWYTIRLYEGGIVELKSNDVREIRTYYRFESDLEKWDTAAVIGIEWDYENAKEIGYYQEKVEETDQISHRMISEEEYLSIIKEYAKSPIKLEWEAIKID